MPKKKTNTKEQQVDPKEIEKEVKAISKEEKYKVTKLENTNTTKA